MNYLNKRTVEDIDVAGKRVLLRCDFNVPLDDECNITDTKRIDEAIKTINYLLKNNAKVILCSHLGRPKGEFNLKYSLKPVAVYLSKVLGKNVVLASDVVGESAKKVVENLREGEVCMLENLRFEKGETQNDPEFSKKLASLADIYVNDAFGTCHRAHSSTAGVAEYLPSACGFLIKKEITIMSQVLENPKRPFVAIIGGAKVSDKIEIINSLLNKVDVLIIGGGMSYTFMNALGYSVGNSLCEKDKLEIAKEIMTRAKEKGVKLVLPVDTVIGKEFSENTEYCTVDMDRISENWMGLDIGNRTVQLFSNVINKAGTVIWNGPMGVFEWSNFSKGTVEIARAIAESGAVSIIGGGDSAAAAEKFGFADKITHISTGGGASLEFLKGGELPGLSALDDK